MKNNIKIMIIILLMANLLTAKDVLNNYLAVAAKNNSALKAKFNEYMASLQIVPQAGALPDPQLAFAYFISPVETRNGPQQARLSLTQMFPWFGTLSARKDAAANKAKAKYEDFRQARSKLFLNVKAAYFDLYFINRSNYIVNQNLRILETFRRLALIKMKAGTASAVDELYAEMELADLENELSRLKDKKIVYSVKFNNLLNQIGNSEIDIPDSLWTDDLPFTRQTILDSLFKNNHEVQQLGFMRRSYQSKERLARKNGLPNISLGIDYISIGAAEGSMVNESGKDAVVFPRIGVSIPLFRKKYSSMVKEAVYKQRAAAEKKSDKINALKTIFEKTFREYLDADRRSSLFSKQLKLAQKAISIMESEYASDRKDFEDVLQMEKKILKYALELEKARAEKQTSVAFIEYLMGK